jgi:hypothetical protein
MPTAEGKSLWWTPLRGSTLVGVRRVFVVLVGLAFIVVGVAAAA